MLKAVISDTGVQTTLKINGVTAEDLEGYTHLVAAIYNNTGLSMNFHGDIIDSATLGVAIIPVAEYLSTGICTTPTASGSFFIGPIVAVKLATINN